MATYNFDCDQRIIQLTSTAGLDMQDLYSRWKDAVLDGTVTACEQAMRVVKEPLAGATFIGPFYFLMNDWQIRPFDSPHELVVTGTLVQDTTSELNVLKLDNLTSVVSITRQVAVEVQTLETGVSGLTASESAQLAEIANVPANVWGDTDTYATDSKADILENIEANASLIPRQS